MKKSCEFNYNQFDYEEDLCEYNKSIDKVKSIPLHYKKRFELNSNININKLEEAGFKMGGWIKTIESPKYYINANLIGDIDIHLEISIKDNNYMFDDYNNIYIIDDNFGQPYFPFYDCDKGFKFLNDVIDEYNLFMDKLVSKDILQEKIISNKCVKRLIK